MIEQQLHVTLHRIASRFCELHIRREATSTMAKARARAEPPAVVQYLAPQLYTHDVGALRRFYVEVLGLKIHAGSSSHAVLDVGSRSSFSSSTASLASHDATATLRIRIDQATPDVEPCIGHSTIVVQLAGLGIDDSQMLNYRARIVTALEAFTETAGGAAGRAQVGAWRRHGYGLGTFTVVDPDGNRVIVRQDRATYSG